MYKNIKKEDIIKNLSIQTGLSVNLSRKIIEDFINILFKNIKKGNLNLKNVGSFKIIQKKQRNGRNPKTNQEYLISARKIVRFTPSNKIKIDIKKLA